MLQSIEQRGRAVILEMYPELGAVEGGAQEAAQAVRATRPRSQTVLYSGLPMVIDLIDAERMAQIASAADAVIVMTLAVGDTAIEGIPILRVDGAPRQELSRDALLACIALSPNRS